MLPWNLQDEIGLNIGSNKKFLPYFSVIQINQKKMLKKQGELTLMARPLNDEWLIMDRTKKMSLAGLYVKTITRHIFGLSQVNVEKG